MVLFVPFLAAVAKPMLLSLSGMAILFGLLAIVSPQAFAAVATLGNHWVDTARLFRIPEESRWRAFDRWVDVDGYALRYSRLVGIGACTAASLLVYLCLTMA
jgi:hypothetical protein